MPSSGARALELRPPRLVRGGRGRVPPLLNIILYHLLHLGREVSDLRVYAPRAPQPPRERVSLTLGRRFGVEAIDARGDLALEELDLGPARLPSVGLELVVELGDGDHEGGLRCHVRLRGRKTPSCRLPVSARPTCDSGSPGKRARSKSK